jgi:hypothetical protein
MAGVASAEGLPLELHILPNGNVRFGDGRELNDTQLRAQIRVMMKLPARPEIHIMPEKGGRFADVARVLRDFQQLGFGAHFGFTVYSR